ncbi:hypothetical protein SAMN05421505_120110 [Sinosporangium album]|uniref:Uncharacterized protein n=1 Tax=Sinosporangium album TaxID=504805 RepID=A0A1G8EHY8_9ACTN|nr:hypothetical protein [Sinosporangium album]SDH69524.1 hypothetical protein SAMN05421505_120110 [Sinosporangium album]
MTPTSMAIRRARCEPCDFGVCPELNADEGWAKELERRARIDRGPVVRTYVAQPRVDPKAKPKELIPDHRDPTTPKPSSPPSEEYLAARRALARETT